MQRDEIFVRAVVAILQPGDPPDERWSVNKTCYNLDSTWCLSKTLIHSKGISGT